MGMMSVCNEGGFELWQVLCMERLGCGLLKGGKGPRSFHCLLLFPHISKAKLRASISHIEA